MGTYRIFCYNPSGEYIEGMEQIGEIAASVDNSKVIIDSSREWWNGPDEDLGHIVAYVDFRGNRPNGPESALGINYTCHIGFFRSNEKTDESFAELAKTLSGAERPDGESIEITENENFISPTHSKNWLNSNKYWTSYVFDPLNGYLTDKRYLDSDERYFE